MTGNLSASQVENKTDPEELSDFYFDLIYKYAPIVKNTLAEFGSLSIKDYVYHYPFSFEPGFQPMDDFLDVVYQYVSSLHGDHIARETVNDLSMMPVGLTANHHGVDFFAQSVQGSFLFSQILNAKSLKQSTVPVIACANIPLNNLTFPRGMLLYHSTNHDLNRVPQKVPIFPDRMKNVFVSLTGAIDKDQIMRTQKRVNQLVSKNEISSEYGEVIQNILDTEYADTDVQALKTYSDQSVLLNHRIWKRMHEDTENALDLVYMELEALTCKLLEIDLNDTQSLISNLMFTPDIVQKLIQELDNTSACWQGEKLEKRLTEDLSDRSVKKQSGNCGTHFFWGVDQKKKQIPMFLKNPSVDQLVLEGKDDKGNVYRLDFEPENVINQMKQGHLLPSLFTCYTTLSLARGVICIGGYYQSAYLPAMQKGVVNVLKQNKSTEEAAVLVSRVETGSYLSGMQTIMTQGSGQSLLPSGPLEIIAGGGINRNDLDKINRLTVKETHLASLFETIPDVVPYSARPEKWPKEISSICKILLYDRIAIK